LPGVETIASSQFKQKSSIAHHGSYCGKQWAELIFNFPDDFLKNF
jgi:hypothetical protein